MKKALPRAMTSLLLLWMAGSAQAQTLVAVDDSYGIPFGQDLAVEAFGVLDNDTLDGENAGENGATAALVSDVAHGFLTFNSDGSFIYTPGSTFTGIDTFTYEAAFNPGSGPIASQATVTLTACTGGPTVFACWEESAYLAKLTELGFGTFQEGFEDDLAWGSTREPDTDPSVTRMGIRWQTNHPEPPASNEITTGSGPARTGLWGVFDPNHGYATGTPTECDINSPPDHCLFHDGFTGTREAGQTPLHGVGGFIDGSLSPNVSIILDGTTQIGFGQLAVGGHQFLGAIDTGGFMEFRYQEEDGKVGQERFIFGDDFTFGTSLIDELVVDFGANGLWHYSNATWTRATALDPLDLEAWRSQLAVSFGSSHGTWLYDSSGWTKITGLGAYDLVAWGGKLAAAFSGGGLWLYETGVWTRLTSWEPEQTIAWGDRLAVDFGPGRGLWVYDTVFTKLTDLDPRNIVAWGDKLAVEFGSGLWVYSQGAWVNLTSWRPEQMAAWGNRLVVDFGPSRGLWLYDSGFTKLTALDPMNLVVWGDKIGVVFSSGLWLWDVSGWTRITSLVPARLEALATKLAVAFDGGGGVWTYDTGWTRIAGWDCQGMEGASLF